MLALLLLAACDDGAPAAADAATPTAAPSADAHAAAAAAPAQGAGISGTVQETLAAGSYTYVRVKADDGSDVWAAVPPTELAVGTPVVVPTVLPMANFHSEALNRDFALVYFAEALGGAGAAASTGATASTGMVKDGKVPPGHPALTGDEECGDLKPGATGTTAAITAAPDGSPTVAGVFTDKAALAGKTVSVKGKVVKFSSGIMGKNWIHLQDGTGSPGTNDLTVTTDGTVAVGAEVVVTGKVTVDQDFGYGYKYAVMLTEAAVAPVAGS